jgi:hypothetical protein
MTTGSDPTQSRDSATASGAGRGSRGTLIVWQIISALGLLAMGGIHLYLVFLWASGVVGVLFVLNAIGGLVLAAAMLAAKGRLLRIFCVLSLVFVMGTLLALVLALTVGFFGVREQLHNEMVVPTLVVESIALIALAVTTGLVFRTQRLR